MTLSKQYWIKDRKTWSGGGSIVLSNFQQLEKVYPALLTVSDSRVDGTPLVLRNTVPVTQMLKGPFIVLPQNSWAWTGKASKDMYLIAKRAALRITGDLSLNQCMGAIRLCNSIPPSRSGEDILLPNVLDKDFEAIYNGLGEKSKKSGTRVAYSFGGCIEYRDYPTLVSAVLESGDVEKLVVRTHIFSQQEYKKLLRMTENSAKVEFRIGRLSREELLREASDFYLIVFPSTAEASPLSLLEVQALGIPYCLSNIPGHIQHCEESFRQFEAGSIENLRVLFSNERIWSPDQLSISTTSKGRIDARKEWSGRLVSYLCRFNRY